MENQIDFSDKFKDIFDLCDVDKDGFIDVHHFKELAADHFGAAGIEELTGIVNLLDPEGRGVISYTDFCEGIQQIIDIQQQASRNSFKGSVSEETLVPLDIAGDLSVLEASKASPSPSSQHTFSEYDYNSQDDFSGLSLNSGDQTTPTPSNYNSLNLLDDTSPSAELSGVGHSLALVLPDTELNGTPLILPPASEDEADSAISGKSSEINENSRQEITDEENYEDYGEIESEADTSDQGHLTPSIQRKRGDRRDPLSRHHKRSCSNRRLTAAALASHLQRSARNSPSSTRRSSLGSDEIFDDIDGNFQDVNGRLKFLEEQLQHLTEVQTETNTKQVKLKDENLVLVQKVHYLEEQLRDMEVKAEDLLSEEKRKHKEFMARQERDKNQQVEYITQRLHRIEKEYEDLKEEAPRLRSEIEKLKAEKMDLHERLLERQENYNILHEEHERLKGDFSKQSSLQQKERQTTGQLLDDMGRELDELRRYKLEIENGSRTPGSAGSTAELPARYTDLQREIHKLKEHYQEQRSPATSPGVVQQLNLAAMLNFPSQLHRTISIESSHSDGEGLHFNADQDLNLSPFTPSAEEVPLNHFTFRSENKHLHDSNEELNAQLLNQCIGEGKSLLETSMEGQSLAQELEHLTKEELLAQLKMERDVNFRLKQYVDRIIITILEKNPSLLEITVR